LKALYARRELVPEGQEKRGKKISLKKKAGEDVSRREIWPLRYSLSAGNEFCLGGKGARRRRRRIFKKRGGENIVDEEEYLLVSLVMFGKWGGGSEKGFASSEKSVLWLSEVGEGAVSVFCFVDSGSPSRKVRSKDSERRRGGPSGESRY